MLRVAYTKNLTEAGCDEAGRGCLAGPVFAAAVILPPGYENPEINDSKKLGPKERFRLRSVIEQDALSWAVASADPREIDELNILNASITAMHRAISLLGTRPQLLLIDGNRFHPYQDIRFQCVIRGDSCYQSVAAASILSKTYRDEYMDRIHKDFPQYGWKRNKGYPTAGHRMAIREHGTTIHHRQTFHVKEQLTFAFE